MTPRSPKQRLLADDPARKLVEQLITPDLAAALQIAFAQFCWDLPLGETPSKSWDFNCQREGAKRLIETLLMLADKPAPLPKAMGSGHLLPDSMQPGMVFQPPKPE